MKRLVGILMSVLLVVFGVVSVVAIDGFIEPAHAAETVFNVKEDFGAKGDGKADDTYAINTALRKAKQTDSHITVYIPEGTYLVSSELFIFSDTTLRLDDNATIIASKSDFGKGTMLGAIHVDENGRECNPTFSYCTHGGYSQIHDIIIEGGTWDRNASGEGSAQGFRILHGENITIRNTTLKRASDHFINVSGTRNTKITNVKFQDLVYKYLVNNFSDYQSEAIHTDTMLAAGEPWAYPKDGTTVDNIVVENCTFTDVDAGVGTHHVGDSIPMAGKVTVKNCTFKNLTGRAGNFYKMKGFLMDGCTVDSAEHLVMIREASGTVTNNTIKNASNAGIKIYNALAGTVIKGNTVENSTGHGIFCEDSNVSESPGIVIDNNQVTGSDRKGISIYKSKTVKVTNNTVLDSTEHGIHVNGTDESPSKAVVTGNKSLSLINLGKYPDIGIDSVSKNCTVKNNTVGFRNIIDGSKSAVMSGNIVTNNTKWERLAGLGRYDTMSEIVSAGWTNTGGTVIIATGSGFADALSAASLAGVYKAPIVLTDGKVLSVQASAVLKKLAPKRIFIAGGEAAVSKAVFNKIKSVTGVTPSRRWGKNSIETSAALAEAGKGKWSTTGIVATNAGFKDALSVAPIAYSKKMPIFLVAKGQELSSATVKAMKNCGIKKVIIVGGTLAVSPKVKTQLTKEKITVSTRLAGDNGVKTSLAIANWGIANGLKADKMGIATSINFPDALAGAALCGKNNSVLLLADDKNQDNVSFPIKYKALIKKGYIFGGTSAVGESTFSKLVLGTE